MSLIKCKDIYSLTPPKKPMRITFGNFDGVHLGHKKIIQHLKNPSAHNTQNDFLNGIMTFEPHPAKTLRQKEDFLLFTYEQKYQLLLQEKLDVIYAINFDEEFAKISAEHFVKILTTIFKVRHITIGTNCSFGHNGLGNASLLMHLSTKYDFTISVLEPELIKTTIGQNSFNTVVSSSRIRAALKEGDIKNANLFLGKNYFITGTVISGHKRGNSLGFPTCNILLPDTIKPKFGVYFVRITHGDEIHYGIANLGIRPTFNETIMPLLEVHIFRFHESIYGHILKVEFLDFIREEKKFSNIVELKNQINNDILYVNEHLLKTFLTDNMS